MAKNVGGVIIDTAVMDKITADMKPKASQIVKTYGNMMTSSAMRRSPVDTGALVNSISGNSRMIETLTFRLQDGVEYGVFQEFGTWKMAAHPFIVPAIEEFRQRFLDAFKGLFK